MSKIKKLPVIWIEKKSPVIHGTGSANTIKSSTLLTYLEGGLKNLLKIYFSTQKSMTKDEAVMNQTIGIPELKVQQVSIWVRMPAQRNGSKKGSGELASMNLRWVLAGLCRLRILVLRRVRTRPSVGRKMLKKKTMMMILPMTKNQR